MRRRVVEREPDLVLDAATASGPYLWNARLSLPALGGTVEVQIVIRVLSGDYFEAAEIVAACFPSPPAINVFIEGVPRDQNTNDVIPKQQIFSRR